MPGLFDRRLLIVSGKGGVGKSTLAAALALNSARAGQRTLVCEINTDERIAPLLGKPAVGPELTRLEENLWAVNTRPHEAMREYALMVLRFKSVYNAVFENRFVRYFLRFIPSLQELVMLGKILFHLQEKRPDGSWRFERIVMDAPATGHAISFLSVPQVILDTVPPGPLARDAKVMRDLLVDEKVTGSVLVALPEEMPVNELLELHQALTEKVRIQTTAVVLNAFVEQRFTPEELSSLEASHPALYAAAHAQSLRAEQSSLSRVRLEKEVGKPVLTVPRMYPRGTEPLPVEKVAALLPPFTGDTP